MGAWSTTQRDYKIKTLDTQKSDVLTLDESKKFADKIAHLKLIYLASLRNKSPIIFPKTDDKGYYTDKGIELLAKQNISVSLRTSGHQTYGAGRYQYDQRGSTRGGVSYYQMFLQQREIKKKRIMIL